MNNIAEEFNRLMNEYDALNEKVKTCPNCGKPCPDGDCSKCGKGKQHGKKANMSTDTKAIKEEVEQLLYELEEIDEAKTSKGNKETRNRFLKKQKQFRSKNESVDTIEEINELIEELDESAGSDAIRKRKQMEADKRKAEIKKKLMARKKVDMNRA